MPLLPASLRRRERVIVPILIGTGSLAFWLVAQIDFSPRRPSAIPGSPDSTNRSAILATFAPADVSSADLSVPASPSASTNCANCGEAGPPRPNPLFPRLQDLLLGTNSTTGGPRSLAELTPFTAALRDAELPDALAALTHPKLAEAGRELRQHLLDRYATTDPRAAREWIDRLSPGPLRTEAVGILARRWSESDLPAALDWARHQPAATDGETGVLQIAYQLARTQPTEALALAVDLPASDARDEFLQFSTSQWAAKEPQQALEWSKGVSDDALRHRLQGNIVAEWSDHDPLTAATAAVENIPPGSRQNDAVVAVIQRWAQQDPDYASHWIAVFPAGDLQSTAGQELVKLWYDQSPEAPGAWIHSLPAGAVRDAITSAYIERLSPVSPDAADEWAKTISDPALRQQAQQQIADAKQHAKSDEAAP